MLRRASLVFVLAVAALLAAQSPVAAPGRLSNAPPGLTASGRLRWQFEALLRDVFGSRLPYASSKSYDTNFACAGNSCFPHADWDPYSFEFASARGSSLLLRSRQFRAGAFGNYPAPLRINGLYIACGPAAKTFLVTIRGAVGFPLACERPTP